MSVERSARIAIVTTSYPLTDGDAAGHFVETEAHALARAGHSVSVFCPAPARSAQNAAWMNAGPGPGRVRVFRAPAYGATGFPGTWPRIQQRPWRALGLSAWALAVRAELERCAPYDRVIGHWLFPATWPIITSAKLAGAARECVVHGSDARLLERLPRYVRYRLMRHLLDQGVSIRCVSNELVRLLEGATPASHRPLQVRVQPSPIEVDLALSRHEARSKLGLAEHAALGVVVARLISGKRVDTALRALELAQISEIVVLGTGPEQARLERSFSKVRFVGQVPRATALCWLRAADVVVSASKLEGAPTALREARALGTSVVSRACGDLSEAARSDPHLWVLD